MTPAEIETALAAVRATQHRDLGTDCIMRHMSPLDGEYGTVVFTTHAYVGISLDEMHLDWITDERQCINVLSTAMKGALLDQADNLERIAAKIRAWT